MPKCDFSKVAEILLQHGCSVNLLHIFRMHFIITPLEGCFYSQRRSSVKRSVHKDFAKFTGKHQCLNLYFNKIASLRTVNLLKKRLRHRCFSENFVKFLRTHFAEHLRPTSSVSGVFHFQYPLRFARLPLKIRYQMKLI